MRARSTRGGKSYTVDTLAELRAEMPQTPLALLLGADAFRGLPSWHRWRELFELAHLVVVPRPGVALDADLPDALAREWHARRIADPQVLRARPPAPSTSSRSTRAADLVDGDPRGTRARRPRIGRNCRFAPARGFGLY